MHRCQLFAVAILAGLLTSGLARAQSAVIVNVDTSNFNYSSVSGLFYASIPNSDPTNPNTLLPINPQTGVIGPAIPIGFNPGTIGVSSDGSNLFTVVDGAAAVQRYNVPTQTADQLITIGGGAQIGNIYGVPGNPNAVAFHEYAPGFSPPSLATVMYQNGSKLPQQIGSGSLGTGGYDIFTLDPTNGARGYGYDNTDSSFTNGPIATSSNGITNSSGTSLGGARADRSVGSIWWAIGSLTIKEKIFSVSLGVQIGAFVGGNNFEVDASRQRFYSVTSSGSTQTIHYYSLSTLAQMGTITLTGIPGTAEEVTSFGTAGLGFLTSNDQAVFVQSVPEPSSLLLLLIGGLGVFLQAICRRRRIT